ncbi:hypothetical protein ABK040_010529 [Willaertia magna]
MDEEMNKLQQGINFLNEQIILIFEKQMNKMKEEEVDHELQQLQQNDQSSIYGNNNSLEKYMTTINFSDGNVTNVINSNSNNINTTINGNHSINNNTTINGKKELIFHSIFQIDYLEQELSQITTQIQQLQFSINKLQSTLSTSYFNLNIRFKQLFNMYETLELLRKIYKFLLLVIKVKKNYHGFLNSETNIPNSSSAIYELEQMIKSNELSNISIIEKEIFYITQISQELKIESLKSMKEGMKNKQQLLMSNALQVYFNFNQLNEMILNLLLNFKNLMKSCIKNGLDPKLSYLSQHSSHGLSQSLSQSTLQPITLQNNNNNNDFKTLYLVQLKTMLLELESIYIQIYHLDLVIKKKRDVLTQIEFINILENKNFLMNFWIDLKNEFCDIFKSTLKNNTQVREIFILEFPHIKQIFKEFSNAFIGYLPFLSSIIPVDNTTLLSTTIPIIDNHTTIITNNNNNNNTNIENNNQLLKPQIWLNELLQPLEIQYIANSKTKCFDKILNLFTKVQSPPLSKLSNNNNLNNNITFKGIPISDIKSIGSFLLQELTSVKLDEYLFIEICKNIIKMIQLFISKIDDLIINDNQLLDSNSINGNHSINNNNIYLQFNLNLFNAVDTFYNTITRMLKNNLVQFPKVKHLNSLQLMLNQLDELSKRIIH